MENKEISPYYTNESFRENAISNIQHTVLTDVDNIIYVSIHSKKIGIMAHRRVLLINHDIGYDTMWQIEPKIFDESILKDLGPLRSYLETFTISTDMLLKLFDNLEDISGYVINMKESAFERSVNFG